MMILQKTSILSHKHIYTHSLIAAINRCSYNLLQFPMFQVLKNIDVIEIYMHILTFPDSGCKSRSFYCTAVEFSEFLVFVLFLSFFVF